MAHSELTGRARALRAERTKGEALLWFRLRGRKLSGWKFRRQVPRGPYIVDFLCVEAGVVVELDGAQHGEQAGYDAARTAYLEAEGLRVVRFWNAEVCDGLDGVCAAVLAACGGEAPHPALSPQAGRGTAETSSLGAG